MLSERHPSLFEVDGPVGLLDVLQVWVRTGAINQELFKWRRKYFKHAFHVSLIVYQVAHRNLFARFKNLQELICYWSCHVERSLQRRCLQLTFLVVSFNFVFFTTASCSLLIIRIFLSRDAFLTFQEPLILEGHDTVEKSHEWILLFVEHVLIQLLEL